MARLEDICEVLNGFAFRSEQYVAGGFRIIRISNVQKGYIEDSAPVFYPLDSEEAKKCALKENDLLLSLTGNVGRVGILSSELLPATLNQRVACIRIKNGSQLTKSYLFHFLNSDYFETKCVESAKGVAQKNMSTEWLKDYEIPLPPLEEQRRIADLLGKVGDLIAKRREQLDKLDLLVKSRFVEMFGDPETNPMNWPIVGIGTITKTIDSGWSGNGKQREKKSGEIAVLKVSAVTKGYFIPEECKVLDDQENIKKYVFPQKGDLLFSRANTKEMVGATAIIKEDYPDLILPDKLWKIRFSDVTNVVYMKYILSSKTIRNKFSAASTGTSGSMYNVSMKKFKAIQIPMPEIGMQNQFASFAESTEKLKSTIQQSLDKLETLKKAIMQQYFG